MVLQVTAPREEKLQGSSLVATSDPHLETSLHLQV